MEPLDQASAKVFFQLFDKINKNGFKKWKDKNGNELIMERYGEIQTDFGKGTFVDLMAWGFENGDHFRNPEIQFIVVPPFNYVESKVFPCAYLCDSRGIYETSVELTADGKLITNDRLQKVHVIVASGWLLSVAIKPFLFPAKRQRT